MKKRLTFWVSLLNARTFVEFRCAHINKPVLTDNAKVLLKSDNVNYYWIIFALNVFWQYKQQTRRYL